MSEATSTQTPVNRDANTPASEPTSERPVVAPAVDIYEDQAGYLVLADVPGVHSDAIDVRFEEGELRLTARRELGSEEGRVGGEFRAADYRRVFRIPEDVDGGAIEAELQAGVLHVRLPKSKQARPRKIAVTSVRA